MHRFALIFAALALLLGARGADARQETARTPAQLFGQSTGPRASEREVRRLIELIGVVEKELATIEVVMKGMRAQMPDVPEKVWLEVRAEFVKNVNRESIITLYVPIYSGHFNATEIRQLIAFYESPVGKKLVAEMPLIEIEAFTKGVEWGQEMSKKLLELLKSKGYKVPSA
ncbi:MAG TPA: DUF2059 domain-containing protein [Pyrinomonadaceae bacterium]